MLKRILTCMLTLALLSACGSETDFANHDLSQNDNALGKNAVPVDDCQNAIAMSPVYTDLSTEPYYSDLASTTEAEYCVTIYEAEPNGGTCLFNCVVHEYCGQSSHFSLKEHKAQPGCYIFEYERKSRLICATCEGDSGPIPPENRRVEH